ncbi:lytic transglycosylase [Rhodanobacter denitrificans]|nr:lytic transglycosylase [Rhodanobacter denitrificans]
MFGVASQGGSADRPAGGFPTRSILCGIAFGCALLWWPTARAGTLYQCAGASGEAVYSSSKVGYHGCKAIGGYAAPAPRRRAAPPRAALNRVAGTVQTTANPLQAQAAGVASLAGVRGAVVETRARRLDAQPQERASLAAVRGSVVTGGVPLPPATETPTAAQPAWDARKAEASANGPIGRTYYYKVVHADGSMYLGDHSPPLQKGDVLTKTFVEYIRTCAACDLHSPIHWNSTRLNLIAYADTIRAASIEYGVDEAFLRAIIHAESAFNPRALSLKGAQGLMQLMPGTASDMGVLDAFDSDQNIRGGARYLGLLLRDFDGNERLAAAAYNAGPGAVQRYKGVPPYAETQVYVERVDTLRRRYGAAIHPPLASRGPG